MYRKRAYRRRRGRAGRSRSIIFSKPTANTQRKQIYSLSKATSRLQRQLNNRYIYATYRCQQYNPAVKRPYSVFNLTAPATVGGTDWEHVFESNSRVALANKVYMRSIGIDVLVTLGDVPNNPVNFTYFVVSLKVNQGAKAMLEDCGEGLQFLSNGAHFTADYPAMPGFGQSGGLVMIDKSRFNIHYCKRFTLSGKKYESTGGNSLEFSSTYKRFYHKVVCGNRILTDGSNDQEVKNIPEAQVPIGSRFYALLFNDAATDGPYPTFQLSQVVTCRR